MLDPAVSCPAGNADAVRLRPTNVGSVVPSAKARSTSPRPRTSSTMAETFVSASLLSRSPPSSKRRLPRRPMSPHSKGSVDFEILPYGNACSIGPESNPSDRFSREPWFSRDSREKFMDRGVLYPRSCGHPAGRSGVKVGESWTAGVLAGGDGAVGDMVAERAPFLQRRSSQRNCRRGRRRSKRRRIRRRKRRW